MDYKVMNLGILAHVDAGKTTLTESILYHADIVRNMGNVDRGTTITDSMELEKARGITIKASTVSFMLGDVKVNLIDTPGHADFVGEVERSLRVLDGVVLVVSAVEGVQPQTRILFRHLQRMKMPVIIFVNKLDRMGADYERTCRQIQEQLSPRIVRMQKVSMEGHRECRVESFTSEDEVYAQQIIGYSERLLSKFLEDKAISQRELDASLRFRVQKGRVYPVYAGTALRDTGVVEVMKGIISWLPIRRSSCNRSRLLSAYVYKVEFDEKGRKKAYFRIFSGCIAMKKKVIIAGRDEEISINNLATVSNGKQVNTEELQENDIGILMDVPELRCGDFLGMAWKQKGLIAWGEPMLRAEVKPVDPADRFRLLNGLKELETEDPLLHMSIDPNTQEIQVNLFGKLQIEILEATLRNRFNIPVLLSGTKTICKAKPAVAAGAEIRLYEKDNFYCAGIGLTIEPLAAGTGNQYETRVSFGYLKKPFQNAVREGVERALEEGFGDSIVDTKVTFVSAGFENAGSTPSEFRRLAPIVLKNALLKSKLYKLEPVMTYQLIAPREYEKKIMGTLRRMEAYIDDVRFSETEMTVSGQVPYDTAKDFQTGIRTMTAGRGIFELEFLEYRKAGERAEPMYK